MKAKLLAIALGIGLCSCGQRIPNSYRAYFNKNCNGTGEDITSLIDINGSFNIRNVIKSRHYDTNNKTILFYKDGLCVEGWRIYEWDVQKYLDEVIANEGKDYFYINADWGCYEIRQDTIIIRSITPGTGLRPISVWETRYKVIDRHTIEQVFYTRLENKRKGVPLKDETDSDFIYLPSVFTPLSNIPDSKYSWLSKERCK